MNLFIDPAVNGIGVILKVLKQMLGYVIFNRIFQLFIL